MEGRRFLLGFIVDNFYELASVLAGLLSQDPPERAKLKKLYDHVEQTYISAMKGAILDKHPQWCVQGHQRAAELYLYQNWPHSEMGKDILSNLNMLVGQMKSDFSLSEGEQLSMASIKSILCYLDQQDHYSEKVLKNGKLMILSAGCSHRKFDALSRPRIYQDNSFCCDIYLFHRKKNETSSLESILLHELGHVLNLSLTGDISAVPEDFFVFGELFFPGLSTTYRNQAPEFFAHCFSMGITSRPEFHQYDAFPTVKPEHKKLFDAYMRAKIASLPQ